VLILREPFSGWLLLGGTLTVLGVMMVNRNTYLRRPLSARQTVRRAPVASPGRETTR
jgi:drug/metabolite transporter (DMT)-like permease